MFMEVLLRELLARIGLLGLVRNLRRVFWGAKGSDVFFWV